MTKEKLIEIDAKIDNNDYPTTIGGVENEGFESWSYFDPFEIDGIRVSQEEKQFGGMDQGSEYWIVLKVEEGQEISYWKIPGWYQSHHGSEIEFENIFEVKPKEKMVTVWVDAETGEE